MSMGEYRNGQKAFTIVELLIVIVVIGILVAIALVSYSNVQNRAKASSAQSAVTQAFKKVAAYAATNADQYPATLADAGVVNSNDVTYQYRVNNDVTPRTYCITATHSTTSYYQNNTTQTTPATGGCPGHGQGGVAPITNLANNPNMRTGISGWAPNGTATIEPSTENARSGSESLKVTATGSNNVGVLAPSLSGAVLVAGQSYNFSAYVYLPSAWPSGVRACVWGSAMGASISCGASSSTQPGNWERISVSFTANNSAQAALYVYNNQSPSPSSGSVFYVDDVMLTRGSMLHVYADGNSPNWAWNGTPNASTSTGPAL